MRFIVVETKISLPYLYILVRLLKKNYAVQTLSTDLTLASQYYFNRTTPHPSERTYFMDHPFLESAKIFLESSLANYIVDAFLCF